MKPKLTYHFYTYNWHNGEHVYETQAVLSCGEFEDVEKLVNKHILSDMWGNDTQHEGIYHSSPDGDVAVSFNYSREITKRDYDVLKQFLRHLRIEPKDEKVTFT